jgi:pentatricopeptide repeat protein
MFYAAAKWPEAQVDEVLGRVVVALEGAHSLRANDEQVSSSLAATYCRLRQMEKAAGVFRKMLQTSPDSAVAQQGLKACEEEMLRTTKPAAAPVATAPAPKPAFQKAAPVAAPAPPASPPSHTAAAAPAAPGDLLGEIRATGNYHSHDSLRSAPFPAGVDQSRRELYLR